MNGIKIFGLIALTGLVLTACAHRYYLGMHGPSIKAYPDIHSGFTTDAECLGCHGPGKESEGRATTHPKFTGCLKCHNDELK